MLLGRAGIQRVAIALEIRKRTGFAKPVGGARVNHEVVMKIPHILSGADLKTMCESLRKSFHALKQGMGMRIWRKGCEYVLLNGDHREWVWKC